MRHTDPRITTEFYAHLSPGYPRNAIDRLAINPNAPEDLPIAATAIAAAPSSTPSEPLPLAARPRHPRFQRAISARRTTPKSRQSSPTYLGAGYRVRTGDIQLGKLTLYQLS